MSPMQWSRPPRGAALITCLAILLAGCGGADARKAKHIEKGEAYLADGNFEKARVEFRNALQIAPTDATARFDNGVAAEKLGNFREAAQFYQGAIEANPNHLKARTQLGKLYLYSALPDKAMETIAPVLDKYPDDAELLTIRAAVRVQQKDMAGALTDAERAVKLSPSNEDAVGALAGIYTASNMRDKARVLLETFIKANPSSVDMRLALAQVYATQNQPAETEQILLDLIRLRPKDRAHRVRLAQFYARTNQLDAAEKVLREGVKTLSDDKEMKYSLIEFLSSRRSVDAAEREITGMTAASPADIDLKLAQGKFYEASRQPDKAEAVYRRIIDEQKLEPAGLSARNRLAALRVQRGDATGADKLVGEVLAKNPRDNDALILRGNIALAKKDAKSAIADLRAVLRDQPNAVPVLRSLARAHLANGEPAIAEETMRRALESNPKDAALRLDLGQLLAQLGKPEQAKPIVSALAKDEPNNVAALETLFRVSAATKDMEGAKLAADGLVSAQPKSAVGYLYQGLLAEQDKKTDDALRLYRQAAELQPDLLDPIKAEVQLLVNAKRFDEALKRLDTLAAKKPGDPMAPELKGQVYLAQGKAADAESAFKTAAAASPKWWEPVHGLALSYLARKDTDAAVAALRKGVATSDDNTRLVIELGTLLERANRVDEAIAEFQSFLKKNPGADAVANNLAMLLVTHRTDAGSMKLAKELASRFSESPNAAFLDTYGWVLYKAGEASAAVPVLERVLTKAPDSPVALYHLGMAQSKSGANAQARDSLNRAVNSGSNFTGLEEAKATLDRIASVGPPVAPRT